MTTIPCFEVEGRHYEVGVAIGRRVGAEIGAAFAAYTFLHDRVLPYHHTPEGQAHYAQLLQINRERYPEYIHELEGMAHGAEIPFEHLFLANLRGEYAAYLEQDAAGPAPDAGAGCSDCAVLTPEAALIGHNEDGGALWQEGMYVVHVRIAGDPRDRGNLPGFTALSYPGFLCGNALGCNRAGICFSVDSLEPQPVGIGLARHLIARSLLDATSLDDALRRVTVPGRASGFGYTIGSIRERRIVYVEAAPGRAAVREIRGTYFHTNHYRELADIRQNVGASSRARLERALEIIAATPPNSASEVLAILGDRANQQYPIYRTATGENPTTTLCTVIFDLDACKLCLYPHGELAKAGTTSNI
jgi:hypothetical protein